MVLLERGSLRGWRDALVERAEGRTLEIGCGTGRNLSRYPSGVDLFASDPDLALVIAARRRSGLRRLVVARAEQLPFRDAVFDTVVSSLVLCSVEDPPQSLRELRRLLVSGGSLLVLEHVRSHRPFEAKLQDLSLRPWCWFTGGCHPNRETLAAIREAGFVETDRVKRRGVMRLGRFAPRQEPGGRQKQ